MKTIISTLFFDRDLVNKLRPKELTNEMLYHQLNSGRITLKEYLALSR
jgi:hypothetical protein